MPFEVIHFRGSEKILKEKRLVKDVKETLEYIDDALYGSLYRRELLRQALDEMNWRENGSLNIIDGRRYQYKGFKKDVALEGDSFASYEYLWTGLLRLQVGFDKGLIETGVLMLTAARSEKSSYGTSRDLAEAEVELLYPTISMPVTIALFDLGTPELPDENSVKGGETVGISVPPVKTIEEYTEEDWEKYEPFP